MSKGKPRRIVLVVSQFPQLSETFIVSKFVGLIRIGWDAHIVCQNFREETWERHESLATRPDLKQRVHVTPAVKPLWRPIANVVPELFRCCLRAPSETVAYVKSGLGRWGWKVLQNFYLDSTVLRLKPHLVHYEFGTLAVDRLMVKEALNCKAVVSFRGYDLNFVGLNREPYYREVWDKADALHFLGKDLFNRAVKRGCPSTKPSALIPPAINTEAFQRNDRGGRARGKGEAPFSIVSVGRLEWKKGYEFALQAVAQLVGKGIRCEYVVVGEGSYLECIAFARHQLGLDRVVKLVGGVEPSKIKEYLQKADVFLHAAVSEGFCNAVLEAQAMELPVVCTDADGLAENVLDGKTGFVVPRRDPQVMADRLMVLAQQPELRKCLGESGRERVRNLFQLESQIGAFVTFYESLWNNQKAAR